MTLTDMVESKSPQEPELDAEAGDNEEKDEEVRINCGIPDEKLRFDLHGSVLGEFIKLRFMHNRDVKIIITSRGSTTGLGKTTLAIILGYYGDAYGWTAEEKGFVNVGRYISKYKSCKPYSALLIDEIEHGADSRRAMSQDNVDLSHAWATLRYRNILSIATLPSTSMLDNRMLELADIWINVVDKGKAISFYVWTNDFTHEIRRRLIRHPYTDQKEIIWWPQLENEDYKLMAQKKDKSVRIGESHETYDKDDIDKAKQKAAKQRRDELITELWKDDNNQLAQHQIADAIGLTQSSVSQIVREMDED